MRMFTGFAGLSAVVLLAGTAYAGHDKSCCDRSVSTASSEVAISSETATASETTIVSGNPCSPCAKPVACSPCKVKCCQVNADIEKLRAVQPQCSTDLCINYQVEAKCAATEPLDLLIQLKSGGRIVYEKLVALENGEPRNKPGKFLFKGSFRDNLDQVYNSGKTKLIVEGNVVKRGSTTSIDRERERVVVDDRGAHGWAQPLYTTGEVLYTPVRWITTAR